MENKKSILSGFLKIAPLIAPLVAVFGILIPVAGFSYVFGYLSVFSIDMDSMPREFTELWATSYYITLLTIINIIKHYHWVFILLIGLMTFALLIAASLIILFGKERIKSFFINLENKHEEDGIVGYVLRFLKIAHEDFSGVFLAASSVGIFIVILGVLLGTPLKMGRDYAKGRLQNFNDKNCIQEGWSNCVIIRDVDTDKIISKGLLIAVTRSHIAIYDGRKSEILPRLDSYSIVNPYNEKLTDESE